MAIDSASKRRSVIGISYHYYSPGVTPDATPGVEWRQQSGHGYGGIESEDEEALVVTPRRRSFVVHRGDR